MATRRPAFRVKRLTLWKKFLCIVLTSHARKVYRKTRDWLTKLSDFRFGTVLRAVRRRSKRRRCNFLKLIEIAPSDRACRLRAKRPPHVKRPGRSPKACRRPRGLPTSVRPRFQKPARGITVTLAGDCTSVAAFAMHHDWSDVSTRLLARRGGGGVHVSHASRQMSNSYPPPQNRKTRAL